MAKGRTRKFYRYQPLPQEQSIRLLQLLPGKQHQKVQCRLQTVSTQSFPEYEAISYVWGPRIERTHILCHGKLVKIPTNLLHCLQRLRHEKEPRILWADSICINQKDRGERSQQVRIMGSIFEQAGRVIVWFGRGLDFDADAAFDLIHSLVPRCRRLDSPFKLEEETEFRSYAEALPSSHWKAFASLLKTPWAARGWVLQEIGLAREGLVICGEHEISWQDLLNTVDFCDRCCPKLRLLYRLRTERLIEGADMQFKRRSKDITQLLDLMRNFKTSDPKDRIYAILAHKSFQEAQQTALAEPIPIDYELPYSEVYLAMARLLLQSNSSVKLLNCVLHTRDTIQGENKCISWVPQWNIDTQCLRLTEESVPRGAGQHTTAQLSNRGHCLDVSGLSVDRIDWQSNVLENSGFTNAEEKENEYYDLANILKRITDPERESRSFEEVLKGVCLVLNAGNIVRSGEGIRPRLSLNDRIADCLAFLKKTGTALESASELEEKYGHGYTWRFIETTRPSHERRFFITRKGYFGIGPEVSLPGDKVCVFFGGLTPFVLWTQEDGTYRLCGECYVHGLMDGEAIEMWKRGELGEETFTLT